MNTMRNRDAEAFLKQAQTDEQLRKQLQQIKTTGKQSMAEIVRIAAAAGFNFTVQDYEEAARASNRCRRVGIATSPVDMLICAVAQRHDWEILTADHDFSRYSKVLGVRLLATH